LKLYGLIGKNLDHSFSPEFFKNKFQKEKINDTSYKLFPLSDIHEFTSLIQQNKDLSDKGNNLYDVSLIFSF